MSATIIVGTQWGDEGKGKDVDRRSHAGDVDVVVRFQGGGNAGHTVVVKGIETILHNLPSGVLNPNITNICGNGMVLDLESMCKEIKSLQNINHDNLHISDRAHIIFPYHKQIREALIAKKIDTTKRGIGPAYADKIARSGVRICDFENPKRARKIISDNVRLYNKFAKELGEKALSAKKVYEDGVKYYKRIRRYVCNTSKLLNDLLDQGKNVLFEGAQGTLLDVDHGTYPYVTSSSSTAGGALTGTGVGPKRIDEVVGILKAYTTRVGEGPFPTELTDIYGQFLRAVGKEFGATTGRPRRCGWLDLVIAAHSARVNGLDNLVLTKLDVLDQLAEIKVCVAYRKGKKQTTVFPADLEGWKPVYKTLPGWQIPTRHCKTFEELPRNAKRYISFIEDYLKDHYRKTPVSVISVGPDRDATIVRKTA